YSNLDARRSAGTFRSTAEVRTQVTGDSLKEFFYELDRIRNDEVSQKEINDAKSYLTGVFPIRLETQEGLIDQLVQIKMLNLPVNFLEMYRDNVQAGTIKHIQRVARQYIKPDEAALIVVGDGAAVLDQIKPYCDDIETYSTSGQRKEMSAAKLTEVDIVGAWAIEIDSPLGQTIPATLSVNNDVSGLVASISSVMGDADLGEIEFQNNGFQKTTSLQMDGHSVEIEVAARFDGEQTEGTVTMQNSSLPF